MSSQFRAIPKNHSLPTLAAIALTALSCLVPACRKPERRDGRFDAAVETRAAVLSRGCFALSAGGDGLVLSLDAAGTGLPALTEIEVSALSPAPERLPWALAPSVSFVCAAEGRVYAAINRVGVLILEEGGAGHLRWTRLSDARLFGERSVASAWFRQGRYYLFLARNEAFGDGDADPRLVSVAPGEGRFRAETAFDPSVILSGESMSYFCPIDADTALAQLGKRIGEKTETSYLRVDLAGGRAERVDKASYLSGFNLAPASSLPPALSALCDPGQARARYLADSTGSSSDIFVFVWRGSSSSPEERAFALSGSQDSEWSAALSAWADGDSLVVLYPDGRLKLSRSGGLGEARLPGLPYSFDYEKVAMAGGIVAASWAESVYPETGRAGLALYRPD